jgi:hypothetical protein
MAGAAVLPATPATFGGVFAAAQGGDVIELTSGNYGAFAGGQKPAPVTIRAAAGQSPEMAIGFTNASNLRLEGMTLDNVNISGSTNNVTIAASRFTQSVTVDASSMLNANVVFDRDTFDGISACGSCYEGRLSVRGNSNTAPVGVAVTNSHFGNGGCSDGVQIIGKAYGVQIGPGNEFSGIKQSGCAAHVDSVQLYGSRATQIVGNYFHDNDTIIMAPDGGDHEVVTDNVMVGGGFVPAVQFGHHDGTVFAHNTAMNIDVNSYVSGPDSDPNRNVQLRDNVMVNGSLNADGCQACSVAYNLFSSSGKAKGTNTIVAGPSFVGGATPTTYPGFLLAAGSPGKGNASDGADRGIRIAPGAAPAPTAPAPPAASKTRRGPRVSLRVPRRVSWAQLRRGLRVRVATKVRARVSLRLDRKGAKRPLGWMTRKQPAGTRYYRLKPRHGRLGKRRAMTLILRVRVTNKAGMMTPVTATIRVRR